MRARHATAFLGSWLQPGSGSTPFQAVPTVAVAAIRRFRVGSGLHDAAASRASLTGPDYETEQAKPGRNLTRVYRHLLKAATPAAHFSRPSSKNLKRLLRAEVEAAMLTGEQNQHKTSELDAASRTMRFLLSAAHSPPLSEESMRAWKERYRRPAAIQRAFDRGISLRSVRVTEKKRRRELAGVVATLSSFPPMSELKTKGARRKLLSVQIAAKQLAEERKERRSAAAQRWLFPCGARTVAHAVTTNLASLTYHHLSPNTRMQPLSRRQGGTDRSTIPKLTKSSIAAAGFKVGDDDLGEDADAVHAPSEEDELALEHVMSLTVSPKPVRGPKQPGSASDVPKRWDGQRLVQSFANQAEASSAGHAERLLQRSEELRDRYQALLAERGSEHPQTVQARAEWRQMRGSWKGATRAAQRQRAVRELELRPLRTLVELVADAQDSTGVWLGKSRFQMKVRGEWLPP